MFHCADYYSIAFSLSLYNIYYTAGQVRSVGCDFFLLLVKVVYFIRAQTRGIFQSETNSKNAFKAVRAKKSFENGRKKKKKEKYFGPIRRK